MKKTVHVKKMKLPPDSRLRILSELGRFYAEKLGLEPVEERPGGLKYRGGNG